MIHLVSVVAYLAAFAEATPCDYYCSLAEGCESSHCNENGVCFGLYHVNATICYEPGDVSGDCDSTSLNPVICGDPPVTTTASFTSSMSTCLDVCDSLVSCQESSTGSYCKTWMSPPVCFGIIVKPDGTLCYEGVDEGCVGEPYSCQNE
ncbi:hypothetical protein FOZ62_013936, partial [Perkinsus olseni]